jgi:hypothetical protein
MAIAVADLRRILNTSAAQQLFYRKALELFLEKLRS